MTLPHAIAVILTSFGVVFSLIALYVSWGISRHGLALILGGAAAILFAAATTVHFLALVR